MVSEGRGDDRQTGTVGKPAVWLGKCSLWFFDGHSRKTLNLSQWDGSVAMETGAWCEELVLLLLWNFLRRRSNMRLQCPFKEPRMMATPIPGHCCVDASDALLLRCFNASMLRCFDASMLRCFDAQLLLRVSARNLQVCFPSMLLELPSVHFLAPCCPSVLTEPSELSGAAIAELQGLLPSNRRHAGPGSSQFYVTAIAECGTLLLLGPLTHAAA